MNIKTMSAAQSDDCEMLLRALPDWFAIEASIVEYRQNIEVMETYVAMEGDEVMGFITLDRPFAWAAEVHVMAVSPKRHRRGVGRALLKHAEAKLGAAGTRFLQVKTLSPSRDYRPYEKTRAFYESMGFVPLQEFKTLWGAHNPCLQMIKVL